MDFDVVDDIRRKLREGYKLWAAADMPEERYRMAKIRFQEETNSSSIGSMGMTSFAATAWRYLD